MPIRELCPMLHVQNIAVSLDFYAKLGFVVISEVKAIHEWNWCHLKCDGAELMLAGGRTGGPLCAKGEIDASWATMFYFRCDDVLDRRVRMVEKGLDPSEPFVTFYQMKEIFLLDPDGHMLTFGQETDEAPSECD